MRSVAVAEGSLVVADKNRAADFGRREKMVAGAAVEMLRSLPACCGV